MRFKRIRIRNYRSLEDATVDLDGLTVLIGANNSGKTTVLDALGLFGSSVGRISTGDFNDPETFVELDLTMSCEEGEMGIPARFCVNGELTVKKRFSLDGDRVALDHLVRVMRNSDFDDLRGPRLGNEIKAALKSLRPHYADLPGYGKGGKASWTERFEEYDRNFYLTHPDHPKVREEYVAWDTHGSPLEDLLNIIHVPSMRDISNDGGDGSGSYLAQLISMAIEGARHSSPDLASAVDASESSYEKYMEAIKKNVVEGLNASLAEVSGRYVGDSIEIGIASPRRVLPDPVPSITIGEGGRRADIGRVGGGTQRVYLMALLEVLSDLQGSAPGAGRGTRAKLLVVDEPELYQHPQRQRRMLLTLIGLAGAGEGAAQAVCSTHSPYFIDLGQIAGLRLLRRDRPTRILRTTLGDLLDSMPGSKEARPASPDKLRTWLDINSTHWVTEGFFSRTAVVLEGPGDRNMLLAAARVLGVDFDRHEMSLVPANGKPKIARLVHIFQTFEIPVYVVWDLDYRLDSPPTAAQRSQNAPILRLVSAPGTNPESLDKTEINEEFSCLRGNMTASLAEDLEKCEELLDGMGEYVELQEARRIDESTSGQNRQEHEQKRVLNSRETVFSLLSAIRDQSPERLDDFTVVRVVRQLEKIGKKNAMLA